MKVLRVFFLGLVYGWFMRWIIDRIFLEDNLRLITNENAMLRERIRFLERPPLPEALAGQAPAAVSARVETALPAPLPEPVRTLTERDDLKLIKGIGPRMEKKLNDAGITTFEQMSRLTTTDLQSILGLSKRVVQNADNLLGQARQLAQDKTNR